MISPLRSEHAQDAARLHIAGQPGAFLTSLGEDVLTVLYRSLPQSGAGFGFCALSTGAPQQVHGFVSATTSIGRLFFELGTRRLAAFLPGLLKAYVRRPLLLWRTVQTALYPLQVREHARSDARSNTKEKEKVAELLSIMVAPQQRNRQIGSRLLDELLAACRARQIDQLDVTVDAANRDAQRFYERHAFVLCKQFDLYGRAMCQYRRPVQSWMAGHA